MECDLVECDVETEANQETKHTPSRPASDNTQQQHQGQPDPALPRTPFNPTTTLLSTAPTIPDSTISYDRYPQIHRALPPSPPTPMQWFMHPGQTRQDSTGSGSFYRDAPLPVLAASQAGVPATTPWPPSLTTEIPTPSTQRYSLVQTCPNPSLSSLAESVSLAQH